MKSKEIDIILHSLERTAYRDMPVGPMHSSFLALRHQGDMFNKRQGWQLVLDVRLTVRQSVADTWPFDTQASALRAYKRVLRRLYQSRQLHSWQIRMEQKAADKKGSIVHQEEGP